MQLHIYSSIIIFIIKTLLFLLYFFLDIAKQYPPSIRIIVQETNIRKLKIGELFLITYKG